RRRPTIGGRAIANLAVDIASPAVQPQTASQATGVIGARGHGRPVDCSANPRGRGVVVLGSVAELAVVVGTPAPDRAIALQATTRGAALGNSRPRGRAPDLRHRLVADDVAGISRTHRLAPTPQASVAANGAGVAASRVELLPGHAGCDWSRRRL